MRVLDSTILPQGEKDVGLIIYGILYIRFPQRSVRSRKQQNRGLARLQRFLAGGRAGGVGMSAHDSLSEKVEQNDNKIIQYRGTCLLISLMMRSV
jgi:hypothetical protein